MADNPAFEPNEGDGVAGTSFNPEIDYINSDTEDQAEVYGYKRSWLKTSITWIFILATGGLLRLVFHWVPEWMLYSTHVRCSLEDASKVLVVEEKYKRNFVKNIHEISAENVSYEREYSVLNSGTNDGGDGCVPDGQQLSDLSLPSSLAVPMQSGAIKEVSSVRVFSCKKVLYLWDPDNKSFYRLPGLDCGQTAQELHYYRGLPWTEQVRRRIIYGENSIKVPIVPIHRLLFLEALNPFYIFQIFSVALWYSDDYVYYATVIVLTSAISLVSEVYQMNCNQKALSSTIQTSDIVQVVRNENVETIPSEHLVPGDLIAIPPQGCMMQCDAVLLQGTCIVNESMLTGESVPVTKTSIVDRADIIYSDKEHGRHTLYCGTQVIQTRFYGGEKVVAVVVRTGFITNKGSLVRSIMYPPPVDFKFQQDSYKFVGVLAGIASIGFIYTVITKYLRNLTASAIALDALDLITIVIPPALPMAMTVGILYALNRLKSHRIFCISPRTINISGVINCVCFDKTGTLTEDGLDMRGVVPVTSDGSEKLKMLGQMVDAAKLPLDHMLYSMTTCHSITIIDSQKIGDPLDLKMFESTNWVLEEPGLDDTSKYDMMMPSVVKMKTEEGQGNNENVEIQPAPEIGILRQFPFSSSLQRMSVITRKLGAPKKNYELYCKGSPEMIASLSTPESVPANFSEELLKYTHEGYRVLALGWRPLELTYIKVQRMSREEVECDLEFLGLLVMENRLKDETTEIITQLHQANIRTIMVTGDNILTALSVGRECGLVDPKKQVITVKGHLPHQEVPPSLTYHTTMSKTPAPATVSTHIDGMVHLNMDEITNRYCFAMEGKTWAVINTYFPEILPKLAVRGAVFARMSPDQKQQLILHLQELGYYVGMCGDGANDCGALKAAHAGISLSEAEASVASPFTSAEPNISCVPILIREGRCALVTSFGIFKYMAAYSLTQFVSIMILYSIDSNLTDLQFLWIDLFLITVFAIFFGRTDSYKGPLASYSPPAALLSVAPILSIIIHMATVIGFQTFCFFYVQEQPWYVPFNQTTADDIYAGHENYAVFSVSQFQYIVLAVVFSRGPPFRKSFYTNYLLSASILVMTAFSIVLTICPPEFIIDKFELVLPPPDDPQANFFRWQMLLFSLLYSAMAFFIEYVVIDYVFYRKCKSKFHNIDKSKKKYLAIERDLQNDKAWPSLTSSDLEKTGNTDKKEVMLDPKKLIKENGKNKKEANGHVHGTVTTVTQFHSSL
ncbi:polyamine-transporting ATPase 13A3 isoform X2 [Palaemon carinicauda]|uniref:polyamine-transporting ATPase 13A3 isoform X2 n=1 Tax=Palaemon carinicauda TaxID=392227 RepID=UPI0035B58D17